MRAAAWFGVFLAFSHASGCAGDDGAGPPTDSGATAEDAGHSSADGTATPDADATQGTDAAAPADAAHTGDAGDTADSFDAASACPVEGAPCDDGDPCTTADHCAAGQCVSEPLVCDDGDPCTVDDHCEAGACVPGAPNPCDDGHPCTVDTCTAGACAHDPCALHMSPCDDGSPCTLDDLCRGGECVGEPICDDGDACTVDSCDPTTMACDHDVAGALGLPCDDGSPCTVDETCTPSGCLGPALGAVPGCAPGESCPTAIPVTALPFVDEGDTSTETDHFDAAGCAGLFGNPSIGFTGSGSPDRLYTFTAPANGVYSFELAAREGDLDAILSLYRGCPGAVGTNCIHAADVISDGGELLARRLDAGDTLFVLVDGYTEAEVGPYQLTVRKRESICYDGLDNDGDGQTDCDDEACAALGEACTGALAACLGAATIVADLPGVKHSVTLYEADQLNVPSECNPSALGGEAFDRIMRLEVLHSGRYELQVSINSPAVEFKVQLATSCPPIPAESCLWTASKGSNGPKTLDLEAGKPLYLLMGATNAGSKATVGIALRGIETECEDGIDDDQDGETDCVDQADCGTAAHCAPPGARCESPIMLTGAAPATAKASAYQAMNLYGLPSCGDAPKYGQELVFAFTAPTDGRYAFTLAPSDTYAQLFVASACLPPEEMCAVLISTVGGVAMQAGQTVYLFAEDIGCGGQSTGCYVGVEAVKEPLNELGCADGDDEDGDEKVDCQDTDCWQDTHCVAEGDTCPVAIDLGSTLPVVVTGDIVAPYVFLNYPAWMCDPALPLTSSLGGNDLVYRLTTPVAGHYRFTLTPDVPWRKWTLALASTCPPTPEACLGSSDEPPSSVEAIERDLPAGQTVFVFVGDPGNISFTHGWFTLEVTVDGLCEAPGEQ